MTEIEQYVNNELSDLYAQADEAIETIYKVKSMMDALHFDIELDAFAELEDEEFSATDIAVRLLSIRKMIDHAGDTLAQIDDAIEQMMTDEGMDSEDEVDYPDGEDDPNSLDDSEEEEEEER